MSNKTLENIVVVSLVGIIICFLFPIVQNIIYESEEKGAESSVYASIDSVKLLYVVESHKEKIDLPFSIQYNGDSYVAYIGNKPYSTSNKIENKGRKPISGKISIDPNENVTVTNLKINNFVCSMPPKGDLNCKRSS